jgi:hypothetical protein
MSDKTEPTEMKLPKVKGRSLRNVTVVISIATIIIVSAVAICLHFHLTMTPNSSSATMTPNPIVVDIPSRVASSIFPGSESGYAEMLLPLPPFPWGSDIGGQAELHLPVDHQVTFTLSGTALTQFETIDVELFFYRGTAPIGNFFVMELDLTKSVSSGSIQLTAGDYYIRMGYSVWTSTSVPPTTLQITMSSQ